MWKYKSQTLISVVGLAVGFICFALATLWIRYEMTFDSFHKNAKHQYLIYTQGLLHSQTGSSRESVYPLAAYLKETFPEIANAASLTPAIYGDGINVKGVNILALIIAADSSFFRMFDLKIIEGGKEFLIPGSYKLAITREKSKQIFGNEHPIGKTVKIWGMDFTYYRGGYSFLCRLFYYETLVRAIR